MSLFNTLPLKKDTCEDLERVLADEARDRRDHEMAELLKALRCARRKLLSIDVNRLTEKVVNG